MFQWLANCQGSWYSLFQSIVTKALWLSLNYRVHLTVQWCLDSFIPVKYYVFIFSLISEIPSTSYKALISNFLLLKLCMGPWLAVCWFAYQSWGNGGWSVAMKWSTNDFCQAMWGRKRWVEWTFWAAEYWLFQTNTYATRSKYPRLPGDGRGHGSETPQGGCVIVCGHQPT